MSRLLEQVARARDARQDCHDATEAAFRAALRKAKTRHSWSELADVAGMSIQGVRWLTLGLKHKPKGEK